MALCLFTAAAGCSSEREIERSTRVLQSWTATARLIGEHWLAGEAPGPYARDGLEKANAELRDERARAASGRGLAPAQRDFLDRRLPQPEIAVAQLLSAVEREDRDAASQALARLTKDDASLRDLTAPLQP